MVLTLAAGISEYIPAITGVTYLGADEECFSRYAPLQTDVFPAGIRELR